MPGNHPHILKLCSDEHAPQVCGYAGDPWVRTPNLDRLAAEGTVFENCYVANPICLPGRLSMLTGRLPRELGTPHYGDPLQPGTPTYMSHFAAHGYQTTCVGKMHFTGPEQMHGWMFRPYGDMEVTDHRRMPGYGLQRDVMRELPEPKAHAGGLAHWVRTAGPGDRGFTLFDESVTREACLHLEDYFGWQLIPVYHGERPLLFEVSWKTPHWPFIAPPELYHHYRDIVALPRKALPENPPPYLAERHAREQPKDVTREHVLNARAAYWALVEYTDRQLGRVLGKLDEIGRRDEFIVMYCSDHGELAGEYGLWGKHAFYDESARVPLIIAGPGIPKGKLVRENVSLMDIWPTLAELAGLEAPSGLRGQSMAPLLRGDDTQGARTVHAEAWGWQQSFMAKRGDVKYIFYGDGDRQLFDLACDPDETENLAASLDYAQVEEELHLSLGSLPAPWRAGKPVWKPEGQLPSGSQKCRP